MIQICPFEEDKIVDFDQEIDEIIIDNACNPPIAPATQVALELCPENCNLIIGTADNIIEYLGTEMVKITGTEDCDCIVGTKQSDMIEGLGGDDIMFGLEGDDLLLGILIKRCCKLFSSTFKD